MTAKCNEMPASVAVKVGSNVLTRPDGTLDITRMSAIVDQIAALHRHGIKMILISSGAVASGRSELSHQAAALRNLDSVSQRQLFSAVGQAKLINRYYELFRDHGIACGQVLTTKESFSTRRHYLNQRHCMRVMLNNDVIPIVNENDTVSVTELMFTDNDELSGLIASMMDMNRLILLSNVDGVMTGDPALADSRIIPVVEPDDDLSSYITAARSSAGRGGMASKHRIARRVASEGIAVVIANGRRDNILLDLIDRPGDTPHTLFKPSSASVSSVKKWIAHSEDFAKGEVEVNDEAAALLLGSEAVSVLPIGVTAVRGDFEKGDIVRVTDPRGATIAIGRAHTSATAARADMGKIDARYIIHADYLYIEQ